VLIDVVSKRPDLTSSLSPGGISSNNNSVWNVIVRSIDGPQFESDSEGINVQVSSDGDSSFNISSSGIQVSKSNNVKVSEGDDLVLEWDQKAGSRDKARAFSLKVWADVRGWGRWWRWEWVRWADKSVDLVGGSDASNNDDSLPYSEWVIKDVVWCQKNSSWGSRSSVDGSSRSNNIVQNSDQVVSRGLVGQKVKVIGVSKVEVVISKGNVSSSEDVEDELGLDVTVLDIIEVSNLVKRRSLDVDDDFEVTGTVAVKASSSELKSELSVGSSGSPALAKLAVKVSCVGKVSGN